MKYYGGLQELSTVGFLPDYRRIAAVPPMNVGCLSKFVRMHNLPFPRRRFANKM